MKTPWRARSLTNLGVLLAILKCVTSFRTRTRLAKS